MVFRKVEGVCCKNRHGPCQSDKTDVSFNIEDRSYLAMLKREIHRLSIQCGLTEKKVAEIDIVVAEIGSNIIKHAGQGEVLVMLTDTPLPAIAMLKYPAVFRYDMSVLAAAI
jgi:hypothetical protein